MTMHLLATAKKYAQLPSDVEAMTAFLEALYRERSVEEIKQILPLDYERITGHVLLKLVDLLPQDVDLMLTIALWYFHFGQDEDAGRYLECAKRIAPYDRRVVLTEIYLNFGQPADEMLSLCRAALAIFSDDKWVTAIKEEIETKGQVTELRGPELGLEWQKLCVGGK
jgi:hypothetical protein